MSSKTTELMYIKGCQIQRIIENPLVWVAIVSVFTVFFNAFENTTISVISAMLMSAIIGMLLLIYTSYTTVWFKPYEEFDEHEIKNFDEIISKAKNGTLCKEAKELLCAERDVSIHKGDMMFIYGKQREHEYEQDRQEFLKRNSLDDGIQHLIDLKTLDKKQKPE